MDYFNEDDIVEGDQMGAVKPFKGEVANSVPSWYKPSKNDNLPPYLNLFILYKKIILLILFYKKRNGNL